MAEIDVKAIRDRADAATPPLMWRNGEPPKPWRDEWFIAETIYGDRVVLRSLPEEYSYDYKTADETYIKAKNIKRWMQFPDSNYCSPACDAYEAQAKEIERLKGLLWEISAEFPRMLQLSEFAYEEHRLARVKSGHGTSIQGTYKSGATWGGIYQSEVNEIERVRALSTKLAKDLEND